MKLPLTLEVKEVPPRLLTVNDNTATFSLIPSAGTAAEIGQTLEEDEEVLSSLGVKEFSLEALPTGKYLKRGGLSNLLRR